jgi:hypothetical protein
MSTLKQLTDILSLRAQGPEVTSLQAELIILGVLDAESALSELISATFGDKTNDAVRLFQANKKLPVTGVVENVTENTIQRSVAGSKTRKVFWVVGLVSNPNGKPAVDVDVHVFEKELRGKHLRGQAATDRNGDYLVCFDASSLCRQSGTTGPALVVRVTGKDGGLHFEPALSDTVFNAARLTIINVTLATGDTAVQDEYDKITSAIQPLLCGVKISDLREDSTVQDITYLSNEAKLNPTNLQYLVISHRLFDKYTLPPQFTYALLREDVLISTDGTSAAGIRTSVGLSTPLQPLFYDIVLLPFAIVQSTIQKAVNSDHFVSNALLASLPSITRLLSGYVEEANKYISDERSTTLMSTVESVVTSGAASALFDVLGTKSEGDLSQLLQDVQTALTTSSTAASTTAPAASTTATSTAANQPSSSSGISLPNDKVAMQQAFKQFSIDPKDTRGLARLDQHDWESVLQNATKASQGKKYPSTDLLKLHALALAQKIEKEHPTTAFGAALEKDTTAFPEHREAFLRILSSNADFDLARSSIEAEMKKHDPEQTPASSTTSMTTTGPTTAVKQKLAKIAQKRKLASTGTAKLKSLQRVFKVTPTFRHSKALMDAGITSSAQIHALGEKQFVQKFAGTGGSFTPPEASTAFHKAQDIHIASGILAGQAHGNGSALKIAALGTKITAEDLQPVAPDFPNITSLFQFGDYCDCDDCVTVWSPGAYLVDVLQWLKNRQIVQGTPTTQTAKDILFSRRPDLGETDLSCPNTNTEIPYIDFVCELLEQEIAPAQATTFAEVLTVGPGAQHQDISPQLLTALQGMGLPFTSNAMVSEPYTVSSPTPGIPPTTQRLVRDTNVVCKMTQNGSSWDIVQLRQTYGTADQLAAAPEYVNGAAYALLQGTEWAFKLPYDLPLQESRGYFGQFSIARGDLMRALAHLVSVGSAAGRVPSDAEIAGEDLGLSPTEQTLITATYVPQNPSLQDTYWNATDAINVVNQVSVFLTKTSLDFTGLQGLLALPWINPSGAMYVKELKTTTTGQADCNLADMQIEGLDDPALDRFHRFIRLSNRQPDWTVTALDQLIRAPRLGHGTLDNTCLVFVDQINQIQAALPQLTRDQLVICYDLIPTTGGSNSPYSSPYYNIFLNTAAVGEILADFQPANVTSSTELLSTYVAYLALCLGLSQSDTSLLISTITAPAVLSMQNLATLYAYSILSVALGLQVSDLLILLSLAGPDLLTTPEGTLHFIADLAQVRTAAISPVDLQYYLTHQAVDLSTRALTDDMVTTILTGLQPTYTTAQTVNASTFDGVATVLENTTAAKKLLAKLPTFGDAANLALFDSIIGINGVTWQSTTTTPAQFLGQTLQAYVDMGPIDLALANVASNQNAFIQIVMMEVSAYLYQQAKNTALLTAMTTQFGLPQTLVQTILSYAHITVGGTSQTLNAILTNDVLIGGTPATTPLPVITPTAFSAQYKAIRLLQVLSGFVSAMGITNANVQWMLTFNGPLGWLPLDGIPYDVGMTPITFSSWLQIANFQVFISQFPPVNNPLDPQNPYTVNGLFETALQSGSTTTIITYLAQLTGWDLGSLTDLSSVKLFNYQVSDFQQTGTYLRLEPAVTLLRRIGINLAEAQQLITPDLTAAEATLLRQLLKARYSDADWLGVLKSVQDPLRLQKRDALVAYILSKNPLLTSTDDIYDYFLIDVEMGSCMSTSRIVQGHATVQLFVERCRLGLEPQCIADFEQDPMWAQWSWMEQYRLWQANREVFIYPENWIVPNLRDDKSEQYVALENTLQQNALTNDNVEQAAITYLMSLDDIADMDVMAVYYDTNTFITHIFSRTKGGSPQTYYYRQMHSETTWTPWTKVPLDITGDHLLAFERNSRLTLVWPLFSTAAQTDQPGVTPAPSQLGTAGLATGVTMNQMQIQLAMSELSATGWTPKVLSKDPLYFPSQTTYLPPYPTLIPSLPGLPQADDFAFMVSNFAATGQLINVTTTVQYITWLSGTYRKVESVGSFSLNGCKGYPEPLASSTNAEINFLPQFENATLETEKFIQTSKGPPNQLAEKFILSPGSFVPLLDSTPNSWVVTHPMQMSDIDWVYLLLEILLYIRSRGDRDVSFPNTLSMGAFMPYFFGDTARTYLVIPGFYPGRRVLDLATTAAITLAATPTAGVAPPTVNPNLKEATFSYIYPIIEDLIYLVKTYLVDYMKDPSHTVAGAIAALEADSKYIEAKDLIESIEKSGLAYGYQIKTFYHPLICMLIQTLNKNGFPALFDRKLQLSKEMIADGTDFDFSTTYKPSILIAKPYPKTGLTFGLDESYSSYNWELFFHLPFEVAVSLNANQQFEDARSWYHYLFNPTGANDVTKVPQKYWITKPFFRRMPNDYVNELIGTILGDIAADPDGTTLAQSLSDAVTNWRNNPYAPFVVARSRTVAFQIAIVLGYIKNLIDWGDSLFAQFTREMITQATQLYILADKLLGPKPTTVKPAAVPPPETFNQIEANVDIFGNALIDFENMVPDLNLLPHKGAELPSPLGYSTLYFCIPPNTNMLAYWDLVSDRLFKIRNCENINGIVTPLPLFSPPIDPGALVRATAQGLSPSQLAAGLAAPLPLYRFSFITGRTTELIQTVSNLGSALQQALERQDAEALSRLQSTQQLLVLAAIGTVKQDAINEAQGQVLNLQKSLASAQERYTWYTTQPYMNAWEITQVALAGTSLLLEVGVGLAHALAGVMHVVPNGSIGASGFGGTPLAALLFGGENLGHAGSEGGDALSSANAAIDKASQLAATQASYQRRSDEWGFQANLANLDIATINQQISTAQLHLTLCQDDLTSHKASVAQQTAVDAFLKSKYTNTELYQWMVGQIKNVYFNGYNLAFDAATKLERSFRRELGNSPSPAFINYGGYFDSLHNGLLAAQGLQNDVQRMQTAFYEQNAREFELSKQIALSQLDPAALLAFKATGTCSIFIPEAIFDLDHPGQYMRRHKSVSLSIPCVAGPYTSVPCTLTLLSNKYRNTASVGSGPYGEQPQNETRFTYNVGAVESIATSTAVDDDGLFELNFRDERYLPFEGTGVIANWQLTMPKTFRQFNYMTITDVILHVKYTARDGGSQLTKAACDALDTQLKNMALSNKQKGVYQYFNIKQSFPNAWWTLLQSGSCVITIGLQHMPFWIQNNHPSIDTVTWICYANSGSTVATTHDSMSLNGTPFNIETAAGGGMIQGNSGKIILCKEFTLADTDAKDLVDLNLLVHINIS